MREYNFDGLVGPTHNYGGLAPGNVASTVNEGQVSNPREAALQGLAKMRFVHSLGAGQAVLPPHPRPSLRALRALGFTGSDEHVLARAAKEAFHLVRLASSAAAMWTANAATVAPSADTSDARVHLTPANLQAMFHRAIEADTTTSVLKAIFHDPARFVVHDPLPGGGQFADEGAANHTRLFVDGRSAVHLFAWGRRAWGEFVGPKRFPARQTLEASQAVARLHHLDAERTIFAQQSPEGIDGGAFHTDVLAVGSGCFLMLHERAFNDMRGVLVRLRELMGDRFCYEVATEDELPVKDAVAAYPFNSQLIAQPDGAMEILAPKDSEENPRAKEFLERVVAGRNPVSAVRYLDVRQSMHNGGGPACLRLRVALTDEESKALSGRVLYSESLAAELEAWVQKHYRDRLIPNDLSDPSLARESMTALDELTGILKLGSVYDFQRSH
ncbi:MAG: N-succinylarginine dihydrolase [Polyangiales bacterium]